MQNHSLAGAIADVGWGEIIRQLEYKGEWYGTVVAKVNRWFPSSKRCSDCGHEADKMPLSVREWTCKKCGSVHDRDQNAAINLSRVGHTRFQARGETADILPRLKIVGFLGGRAALERFNATASEEVL
jgi:putative transposase